ncbi:MAG: phosphate/phosphite/phosphonate ABC transporter substrate-binding protein [Betaproteobacteria bacterium]|nr:phosphate/phosphite/phosphonate ABC transporter substrate-binding protein [Betaproteobacteria bacterium]
MISLSPSRTLKALMTCAVLCFGALSHAQQVFRVTTIPEEAATEQVRKFTPLANYLEKQLGVKVEFTPVNDYPAAVEALVNKKVDLVWFGGFTHVQANLRSGGKIVPLAQREEDTKFQSVFIAKTDSGIKGLADMKGKQISFGSQSSTSGHLMPRNFLLQANINPEKDFKRIAYSGAHDATIVSENKVDTKAVDVFYTTPPYFNYNWSVHADMPKAMQDKVKAALLALNDKDPAQAEILKLNRATRYVETRPENYKGLESAAKSAGLL